MKKQKTSLKNVPVRTPRSCVRGRLGEPALPAQPPESDWGFVRELRAPLHDQPIQWERRRPSSGELDMRAGVTLDFQFPDPAGTLATMYADFQKFLRMGGIKAGAGCRIVTDKIKTATPETFRMEVGHGTCRILAGDTEGIRRGLVFLEDALLRNGGPFLAPGRTQRTPVIRTRISRCFFGPIKRPPKNRDELLDDVDYYPDEYLNRLAHDGVNGLWLTVEWKDLVLTDLFPNAGADAARRLVKLNRTIAQCARYGIKIYIFCIEPAAVMPDSPMVRRHPELAGHRLSGLVHFCVSTKVGRDYVENATRRIFQAAPGLGGMMVISVGERPTHCYSSAARDNNCPRCAKRLPHAVLADTLSAMARGMRAVNPDAELISWPYSQYHTWGEKLTVEAADHVPRGVILQQNFESGARARQLGRVRYLADYWLSYVGPSKVFSDCARRAVARDGRMSAKLQVGCSHEVATVPFVPVPGNLYGKYRAMHRLGVSAAMYGWYFGTYPSLMTRAAGELAFAPFPKTEREFLLCLAKRDWGKYAVRVAAAWEKFQAGYRQFPYTKMAGYYGFCHDGPVTPLYPIPRDWPLAPTWQIKYGVSGDRIGEMICYSHTAREFQTLLAGMAREWRRGLKLLAPLRRAFRHDPERLRDLGVAEALGIQFESARNILGFYLLREQLPLQTPARQVRTVRDMEKIVQRELAASRRLLALAQGDPRLGFHSEAEGYKYHPALLRWRMRQLRRLRRTEFPKLKARIKARQPVCPGYAAPRPGEPVYHCAKLARPPAMTGRPRGAGWDDLAELTCEFVMSPHEQWVQPLATTEHAARKTVWKAGHDGRHLYFGVVCDEPEMARLRLPRDEGRIPYPWWNSDCAGIMIEPRRLWPCQVMLADAGGARWQRWPSYLGEPWRVAAWRGARQWSLTMRIPLACLREPAEFMRPLRIDILRAVPSAALHGERVLRWRAGRPWPYRLGLRTDNPADLGWLVFNR